MEELVWIIWIPTAVFLLLWVWDHRQGSRKLQHLTSRYETLERVLNEFIEESGKITQEFSRLIPSDKGLRVLRSGDSASQEQRIRGVEKRHLVLNLAQKGHSAKEIAQRLMLPFGEVHLILSLDESKRTRVSA